MSTAFSQWTSTPEDIDEQTVCPVGPCRKQRLPGPRLAFETGDTEIPVGRVEAFQVGVERRRGAGLGTIEFERTLQMSFEHGDRHRESGELKTAEVVQKREWWVVRGEG